MANDNTMAKNTEEISKLKHHHPVVNIHLLDATKYHVSHAITFNINKILKWTAKVTLSFLPHTSTHQLEILEKRKLLF